MCEDFNKLVEQYMLLDKKTLAELLALKELGGRLDIPVIPTYPTPPSDLTIIIGFLNPSTLIIFAP